MFTYDPLQVFVLGVRLSSFFDLWVCSHSFAIFWNDYPFPTELLTPLSEIKWSCACGSVSGLPTPFIDIYLFATTTSLLQPYSE